VFAFVAAISQAAGIIVDKIVLTRRRVETRVFIPILFLFLAFLTAILIPFLGFVSSDFFKVKYILFFLAMLVTAIIWNFFYYRGAQKEKVQEFELIIMFQPLMTILLAAIFIEKDVNIHLFIASILASIALILAHLKKMHFELSEYSWGLVIASFFISVEIIFQKILLEVFSPASLYFYRTAIIFIFFYIYYRPHIKQVSNINLWLIMLTSALGVAQMVTKFYGFDKFGVIYTSLVLIISPILVYILSTLLLRERLRARMIVSFFVILGCIVYASLLGK